MRIADLPPAKPSAARERLLETARRIFYAEGVNTVGVQRIIEEAGVTLATFYRHFPSKQDLILAYLQSVHDDFEDRATVAEQAAETARRRPYLHRQQHHRATHRPRLSRLRFINAATEFENPDGPIMRAVLAHRAWFYGLVRDAFATAGHPRPELAASRYVMLRDGATTAGHLGDPSVARDTFDRGIAELLRFTDDPAETDNASADHTNSETA